jgi:Cytochrome P460
MFAVSRAPARRSSYVASLAASALGLLLLGSNGPGQNGPVAAASTATSEPRNGQAAPIYGIEIPPGYREWTLISVASVGAPVSDLRAKLGNDAAIRAYRAGTLPFPDGTIIARLAWKQTTSEENNRALGPVAEKQLGPEGAQKLLSQSFVAGPAINVQFMVKDSKKYASTGGWGFAQFDDGKPAGEAVHKTCFGCHVPAKDGDFVFTRYAP